MRKLSVLSVMLFVTVSAYADVTLHGIFGDHMVLQRDIPVAVFGAAEPGEKVVVSFLGQEKSATAGKDGKWIVKLDAMKASTNSAEMTVTGSASPGGSAAASKNTLTVKDIVIGDVWVCSGQSNMGFILKDGNRSEDIQQADFPLIRQVQMPWKAAKSPLNDVKGSWNNDAAKLKWTLCTPESSKEFTAVGFYFGRKVFHETGVPIGLLNSSLGATAIEPWVSAPGLAAVPGLSEEKAKLDAQFKAYVDTIDGVSSNDAIRAYVTEARKALANNTEMPAPVEWPNYPIRANWFPGGWHCLYNGMIHPFVNFGIKGVLWYQGESNGGDGDIYFHKMEALIGGWRKAWRQGDFPFYFVQLPAFQKPNDDPRGGDGWAHIRMAQFKALTIPNTGMAVAIDLADVGNPGNIHPKNKRDVGERLALWALAKDYGKKDLVYSGPLYKGMKIEGGAIRLVFDSVGSGLVVATKKGNDPMVKDPQGKLQKFAIAGENKKWVWANAVIDGATVVVSSPDVPKPVAVRYAFAGNPEGCNLYNNEGLPAAPFRTDEW